MCKACISSPGCAKSYPECGLFNSKCAFCTAQPCPPQTFHGDYACYKPRVTVIAYGVGCTFYDVVEKHCRKTNKNCTNCIEYDGDYVIHFKKRYSKLSKDTYTSIRRTAKWKVGAVVNVIVDGKQDHAAEVLARAKTTLASLDTTFLIADTDEKDRESAIKLLNSFYEKPIGDREEIYVYFLGSMVDKKWAKNKSKKGVYIEDDECAKCINTQWCKHGPKYVPCDIFKDSGKGRKPKQINLNDLR